MSTKSTTNGKQSPAPAPEAPDQEATKQPKCGIIMPIAEMPSYSEKHWQEVRRTIITAAQHAGFESDMVSTGADVGVIHANIINNIFQNEIVVCDVSGKNANVMFELGLRLASQKPVIIIKDDATSYSFDTSPIEHLNYRKDMRMYDTLDFQAELTRKIRATYLASQQEGYKTFLDHFGNYTLATVKDKTLELNEFAEQIFSRLDSIEQRQATNNFRQGAASRISPPLTEDIISYVQQLIQSKVNSYIGDEKVEGSAEYTRLLTRLDEAISGHFAQELASISPALFRQALKMAARMHLNNRAGIYPVPPPTGS
jgi:hypothetical protein